MGRTFSDVVAVLCGSNIFLFFLSVNLRSGTAGAGTDLSDDFGIASSLDLGSVPCNFGILSSMRSTWLEDGEPCNQKLPFEFWIYMKAEGSAEDPDADHVRTECIKLGDIGTVELVTPEDWDTAIVDAAPGQLLRETKRAASYIVQSPLDLEAMCSDDQVTKVSRIIAITEKNHGFRPRKLERRLQDTVSVARIAHRVDLLIAGLEELRCERTTGEDQNLCIMSDSFNQRGGKSALQASGDLPPDEFLTIVEDLPIESAEGIDEGSAMTELAYDIAKGANFKFNTMFEGIMAAADDIIKLGTDEACDVIVDDVSLAGEPGFRDGIVSLAVDEVVADGSLYFSSAGNQLNGYRFTSNWECDIGLFGQATFEPCEIGVATHVFNPEATGSDRYFLPLDGTRFSSNGNTLFLHWDEDEGTSRTVLVGLLSIGVNSEGEQEIIDSMLFFSDLGTATVIINIPDDFQVGIGILMIIYQIHSNLENVEMRLMSWNREIFSDFSDGSIFGHQCAASTISVAAFNSWDASGVGGAFADPEEGSVASYSSRGPCYVDSGSGLTTRLKPVTTAATGLATSTEFFALFQGTSASAPVAAAIATIIRAACFPRVVTYSDIMEMLTNYDYTIDVISDADGEAETWGTEAGYGIISADQMLGWVAANCQASCPGGVAGDPHIFGLKGQRFDVSGVNGGWYCMLKDEEIGLQVNVRFTAPLPIEFPHRQLITAIVVLVNEHSLAVEVRDPYDTVTGTCPGDISPCLLNGDMKIVIDGHEMENLLHPTRDVPVVDNIELSATNLPMECRRFGGDRVWAQMYAEMLEGRRELRVESFEEWVLRSGHMAARDWCAKYISERGLSRVQSNHAVLKITMPSIVIRLNVGVNHQGSGEVDYDGTPLPELDFWQMDLGFEGMSLDHPDKMSGILGGTARLMLDDEGREVKEGPDAFRGTIEDYRVLSPLGDDFGLLHLEDSN